LALKISQILHPIVNVNGHLFRVQLLTTQNFTASWELYPTYPKKNSY